MSGGVYPILPIFDDFTFIFYEKLVGSDGEPDLRIFFGYDYFCIKVFNGGGG